RVLEKDDERRLERAHLLGFRERLRAQLRFQEKRQDGIKHRARDLCSCSWGRITSTSSEQSTERTMRGPKGRIGVTTPTYLDSAEDWFRVVPDGVNVVFATLGVEEHTANEFDKARAAVERAARGLIKMGVGALLLGGSPLVTLQPGEGAGDL